MHSDSRRCGWTSLPALLLLFGVSGAVHAQAAQAIDRIKTAIDDRETVVLRGNVRPEISMATAIGAPEQELQMQHMILTLKSNQDQDAALDQLIQQQQDPRSPSYRKFLTPQQYGEQFGASLNDIAKITEWLANHGFRVDQVPAGRRSVVFSGTAGSVTAAFGTPVRKLTVGGQTHYANTEEPSIPAALSDVVGGLVKLNDFQHKPSNSGIKTLAKNAAATPQFTSGASHYLSPADYATIYDLSALYSNQINGTGQSIAIVARSNISLSDLQTFRTEFGLPANNPTVILASGTDPGFVAGDGDEATLDAQWSGAIAPKATIKLVVASSTAAADGVDLSAQYIVNNNLAPVMSVSFGSCEAGMGSGGVGFYNALWQQAAAEGITVLISSGDSGAAGCYSGASSSGSGRAINGLCSSPYDVCVGGTEFTEGSNPGQYWLAGNNSVLGSAQSYIPESVWNESGSNGGSGLWAGGGGASIYFSKPAWQSGAGVPADGARDVPDVSLTASGHDGYLIEEQGEMWIIAGTSASSPSFAGIMALVNQKTGARLGNPNAVLYRLAALQAAGGAQVFHDTTAGSNTVPGVTGFSAAPGYDQATGLGSVDAAVLINHWTDASGTASATLAAVNAPSTLSLVTGGTGTFVTAVTGSATFKSAVALTVSGAPSGVTVTLSSSGIASPGSGSVTATVVASKSAAAGSYTLTVTATGGNLVAKAMATLTITSPSFTLTPSAAVATVSAGFTTAVPVSISPAGGFNSTVTLTVAGLPTGVTASFSPATLGGTATGTSTLTLMAAQTSKAGTYPVTITATGGGLTQTAALNLTIVIPSFVLTCPTASATLGVGGNTTVPLSVAPSGGFNSTVSLTATGLPAGVTASFSPASLSGTATGISTLTLAANQTAKAGTYPVTITATGGGLTKTATVSLTVVIPSFALTSSATSATVIIGGNASVPVSVVPSGGFSSTVSLTAAGLPTGVTSSFSPATLTGTAAGTSTLTLAAAQTAKAGSYTVTITAAGNGVTKTAALSVTIPTPTFALSSSGASPTVIIGGTASVPVLFTPSNGFYSTVSLTATGLPTGVTASFSPATLTGTVAGTSTLTLTAGQTAKAGTYTPTVTATGGGITQTVALSLSVPAPTFAVSSSTATATVSIGGSAIVPVSITPSNGFNSAVTLTAAGLPVGMTASFSPATLSGTATTTSSLTVTAGQTAKAGTYSLTITATGGGLIKTLALSVTVGTPSFTLTPSSASLGVSPGGIVGVPLLLTPGLGFTSTVTLTASGLPAGVTASFSPATLTGSAASTSTLTFTAGPTAKAALSSVTVTATGGGTTKTAVLSLTVTAPVTISLTAYPPALSVTQGSPGHCGSTVTSNITNCVVLATAVTGPTTAVSLSISGLPTGVTASFDNTTAASSGNYNYLTFSVGVSAPLGTYTVTVTGTGGGVAKTLPIQLTVVAQPAFTLGFNNQFITVKAGGPAVPVTLSILTALPGFNSPITLLVAGTQANISQSFSTSTLTVAKPSSTLTVSVASNASPGIYTIWLAGYTNTLTQMVGLSVTVTR